MDMTSGRLSSFDIQRRGYAAERQQWNVFGSSGLYMGILGIIRGARTTKRFTDIAIILAKWGFSDILNRIGQMHLIPNIVLRKKDIETLTTAERWAKALEEMGSTFVKLGQMLSTRVDLLPESYIDALSRLQDGANPLPYAMVENEIRRSLRGSVSDAFEHIDETPVASASIAQVHRATLRDGQRVVIKVRRPGVVRRIDDDLSLMAWIARQIEERFSELQFIQPTEIVEEFSRNLRREVDFMTEAAQIEKFNSTYRKIDGKLKTPDVIWKLTSSSTLVMTELDGVPIRDWMNDPSVSAERKSQAAHTIGHSFMAQYFRMGVFHADPHPGNFLIDEDDTISLLDFGSLGSLSSNTKTKLATALYALNNGETDLMATVLLDMAHYDEAPDVSELERDISDNIDRVYGVPGSKIDLSNVFSEIIHIAHHYRLRLPREFILLDRSLFLINGLSIRLDPNMSASEIARPYAEKFYLERFRPKHLLPRARVFFYNLWQIIQNAPGDMKQLSRTIREGKMRVRIHVEDMGKITREVNHIAHHLTIAILISGLFLASAMLIASGSRPWVLDFFVLIGITGNASPAQSADPVAWSWTHLPLFGVIGILTGMYMSWRLLRRLHQSKIT